MSLPSSASKANCDSTGDDPKLALTVDLADLVDKFNTLLTHLNASGITLGGTTAAAGIGEGLESDGDAASPLLRVKVVSTGGVSRAAGGLSVDVAGLSSATPTQASTIAFEAGSGTKKAALAGSSTSLVGVAGATQAQIEAESSVETIVMPSRMKYHPGVAKAIAVFSMSGGTITTSYLYNVSSVTRSTTGKFTVNLTTAMSSATKIAVAASAFNSSNNVAVMLSDTTAPTASAVVMQCLAGGGAGPVVDASYVSVMIFGDQ